MIIKKIKLREFADERGSLVENVLPSILKESKHFFVSTSKPGVIRGNHYHLRKSEWFCVIEGKCKLVVEDVKTKERKEIIIEGENNFIIKMVPGKAHSFTNIGKGQMILLALINEVFDKNDPDTYPYKVKL